MKLVNTLALILFGAAALLRGGDPSAVAVFPGANSRETYFTLHHIREAHAISRGKGCKVGILDHSFGMARHPDLYAGGKNFVADSDEFLNDREWHGYWMALVLHEIAPGARIYALNTHSFKEPESEAEAVARAIDWAIQERLDVLTYSHAAIPESRRAVLDAALERAHRAGIVTTFIHTGHAGNIMPTGLYPEYGDDDGREPDINVLHHDYTVVFLDEYRKIQRGEQSWWNPPFQSVSSTSPVLGGVVALMKGLRPGLTPGQCRRILRQTARPMVFEGKRAPRVLDALAAVRRVRALH